MNRIEIIRKYWEGQPSTHDKAKNDVMALLGEIDRLTDNPTYTVVWARSDGEVLDCAGLDLRTAAARLFGAIRNSGPITVHSVKREAGNDREHDHQ